MSAPASYNDIRERRRACVACRARKVKCIPGVAQHCERCTTLGFADCVYEPTQKRGVGKVLRVGEACKSCRMRKRKCDAKRPCTRCVNAKRASECEYEGVGDPPGPSEQTRFLIWSKPDPSGSNDAPTKERWIVGSIPQVSTKASSLILDTAPPARALLTRSLGQNSPLSIASPKHRLHALSGIISVPLSFIPPRIPPEPHITLSFLGAERLQLSDAALGDLDMKFRLRVLCRLNRLGIRFTSEKQQALLRGDTSGAVLNPYFIYGAQTLGMYLCEDMEYSPALIRHQAIQLQTSFEIFAEIFTGHDWELRAQVALWKSCEAINTAGLQFIPTYGRPPEFSENLHEKLSVLSQVIYFENLYFLTCGGAEPTMTARIEEEFRNQLQEVYPVLFKICPLTMRTRAILLVRDTVVILSHRPVDVRLGIWRQSCDRLALLLDDYSQTLLFNLQRFQELGDKSGARMIGISCVDCLAHLAVLCEALSQMEPAQEQFDTLCDSALERLGELARDMRLEEYTRLDLFLGESWKKALAVFDARLATIPFEHGTKLRHWKETVEEVYSDFAAQLPGADLPTLAIRVSCEDGRTKGSQYPNLIHPGVLWQYINNSRKAQ